MVAGIAATAWVATCISLEAPNTTNTATTVRTTVTAIAHIATIISVKGIAAASCFVVT